MSDHVPKVVILAAGMGTRMRQTDPNSRISEQQAAVADRGVKAMIPIDRPFLDYVLTRVADAGCRDVCLVIGPGHDAIRDYYDSVSKKRLCISYAIQQQPMGTAHALAAASAFVGDDHCLVMNSDNCYPVPALQALCGTDGAAVVGYERDSLVANGNIAAERIARFAIVEQDDEGYLRRIIEKPDQASMAERLSGVLVSMNCWRFTPSIFTACQMIETSPRGEYEIPDAVTYSIESLDQRYKVIQSDLPVLDLSSRNDIANAARFLADEDVQL